MFNFPASAIAFEAILEDLGTARARFGPLRTAAHAACARHRRAFTARREDTAALAAILGAAEDPFPALKPHF